VRSASHRIRSLPVSRLALLLLGALLGVLLGAWYGWVLSPAQYTETSPNQLRAEFRADYVLMTAEIYAGDGDLGAAAVRLSRLGQADLAALVREVAQAYAAASYPERDQEVLAGLARDLARLTSYPTAAP
jgi:hypothetical protein